MPRNRAHSQHKNDAHPRWQRKRFQSYSPVPAQPEETTATTTTTIDSRIVARSGPTAQVRYVQNEYVCEGHRPRSYRARMTAQVASSSVFIVSYAISLLVFFANFLRRQPRRRPRKLNVFHWILACQASGMESRLQTDSSRSSNNNAG